MTIMEENKMIEAALENGSKPPSTTPAYFVIVHQSQGDQKEERILVANRDASAVASVVQPGPHDSKSAFLSSDCISGGITVTLDNNNMWNEFSRCSTEMVLTKQGRRMFPYCRYWISGMDPHLKYILAMDISPLDTHKYKFNGKWWEPGGKAEPHVLGRAFIHPESPSTGHYWMHQPISFYKLKLTNNVMDQEGHIILHSMHRYLPRLHVIPADKATEVIQLNGPGVHTYTFPQTEFFAVTAYQNLQITQLKIDCNPFAKGFREGTVVGRPPKEGRLKNLVQAKDSPGSKKLEHDGPESTGKLKDVFSMSEQSDADTENESFNAKQEVVSLSSSQTTVLENLLLKLSQLQSFGDTRAAAAPPVPADQPKINSPVPADQPKINSPVPADQPKINPPVPADQPKINPPVPANQPKMNPPVPANQPKMNPPVPAHQPIIRIKEEPEDNYDYNKPIPNMGVQVKQEDTDDEITDEYSHSDDDYPILERHFAQFSTKLQTDRKHSVKRQSGVAKAKLLKRDDGKMPVLYLETCSVNKATKKVSNSKELVLSNKSMRSIKQEECSNVLPSIISCKREEVTRLDEKRPIKRKIYADYAVPVTVRSNRGRKKKSPSVPAKSKATVTPGNDNGVAPVPKRRGRPPKNKGAKVGRPPKKKPPGETPKMLPDFKPDLEDVDGVLFVAFSSKEALDVHTVGKPKTEIPSAPPHPPVHVELTEEQQKIVNLERQLLVQLKTMRHRQVIHPSLQQVGLRLNIVDHAMSIDLRYLGVELPLPFITSDSRWENCGLSSDGLPFVSRTGKTTDYTKIKGWRDKFSTNPLVKSEAGSSETTLKNRSAFCSDELDEYLENEAKLMEDIRGTSQNETVISTVSFQFPTKSASYVRTLDSVLKKQALQASSSKNISKPPASPVKKRKYTRRNTTPKVKEKTKPTLPSPVLREKPVKSYSPRKPKSPKRSKLPPSVCVKSPTTAQPGEISAMSEQETTVQPSIVSPGKDNVRSKRHHTTFQSPHITQRSPGISKVQMKLLELEESALHQGKPRTYVTEERAEIALSALLTIQGFLKSKPFHKMISKRMTPCRNEFCRLGCVCASLNHAKLKPAHCQQEACMFGCDCLNGKLCLEKDGLSVVSTRSGRHVGEDVNSSTEDKSVAPARKALPKKRKYRGMDERSKSLEDLEKSGIKEKKLPGGIKTTGKNSRDSADSCSKSWSPKVFPIWDRADVDNDPEPICIPEKGEVIEMKTPYHRGQKVRGKSSTSKSSHLYTPRSALHVDLDPEDLHRYNSASCARVRVYKRKATEEKAKKDHGTCADAEIPAKENSHKPSKYREQEKENAGDNEVAVKRHKKTDSSIPTKLLNIISDCSQEQDSKKILNIVSQHVDNKEPQSFRVGSFNIELTSENKDGDISKSTSTSRVKISMALDQKTDQVPAKPPPVKGKTESIKLPEQIPLETRAERETKSHGGKGLPFYSKAIPAGKLVARLKSSTLNQSELIQVNGKKFPQAKLLLGQMGALHPANRIAAYITHRLRPNLLYLSKANEANAKSADNNAASESSTTIGNLKVTTDGAKTASDSPQSKTVLPSTPSGVYTHSDMGEAGSQKKEGLEVKSPEPSAVGLPKIHTQTSPLVLVSTPVSSSSAVTVVSSSPVNMVSTTPSLSSGAVPPTKNQATSLPIPLIGATKLVTKDSSLPVSPTLSNDTSNMGTLPSGPSKCVSIPPPALIRAPCPPVTTTVTSAAYPGTNKTLAASVASSLVASANMPTIGLVGSPTGRPTVTLRAVTSPSATTRATLTSGLDKRLGPRLLLIPVSNSSTVRPVQCLQTSPGQKMVLQPIKGPNGVNLFRHPNGQIIQLLPLQQIQASNAQQSQRVVIRSPGPAVSIKLPLKTKTEVAAPTIATTGSSSVPPAPSLQTVSLSKISPVKSGVTVIPTSPSQIATLRLGTPPKAGSDVSPTAPKLVAYTSSGCGVITSTGIPLQSGGLPVLKCATSALTASPQDSAAKTKVIFMTSKPAVVLDANKLANFSFLKSAMIVSSSEQYVDRENSKECKGSSSLETDNTAKIVDNHSRAKESDESIEKMEEGETSAIPCQMINVNESDSSDISSGTLLKNTNQDSLISSQKISIGSADKEAAAESDLYPKNSAAKSVQDPEQPAPGSPQDRENSAPESSQDPENPTAESDPTPEHLASESDKPPEKAAAESDQTPEHQAAESDQAPEHLATASDQDPEHLATASDQDPEHLATASDQDPEHLAAASDQDPEHLAAASDQDPEHLAAASDQDPEHLAAASDQDPEHLAAASDQDPEHLATASDQDPEHLATASDKDPEHLAAASDKDPEHLAAESDKDPKHLAADGYQDPEPPAVENDQDTENSSPKTNCISFAQKSGHTIESADSTAQVHPIADSAVKHTLSKSEPEEDESRKGDLVTDDTTINEQDENLPSDPGYNSSTQDSEHNSQSEDDSEPDESVDIETVEELSEKMNIAHLKATAAHIPSHSDKCPAPVKSLKGQKKSSKVNGDDMCSAVGDVEFVSHRLNHTANERKRRNEMRDLFEELKNALGLHNLPKVSKSYILKKAIEEIEDLTDAADSLIRQKTLMSQKQSQLIKKVSNLSGKPKEVVLKKLEYLYAKQKALESESKNKDLEEDLALNASVNKPPPPFPSLRLENEAIESSSSKTKPIILTRKHVQLSVGTQQPSVITKPSVLIASTKLLAAAKEASKRQLTGIVPTLVQDDVRTAQMPTGVASVVIQLPGAIQLKGLIGNSSDPITLSAVPHTMSAASPYSTTSENDDLSMMPKIVNVTSLAAEAASDLVPELGVLTPVMTKAGTDAEVYTPLAKKTVVGYPFSDQPEKKLIPIENLPSTSHPEDTAEEKSCSGMNKIHNSNSIFPENLALASTSIVNAEEPSKSETASMNGSSLDNATEDGRGPELELELKKLLSAVDDAELEPSELSDVMGDHENSDETLTSLLNEIALLNQQLNNDPGDVGTDIQAPDTPSRESVVKSTDGNSSPFFFGRLKELCEAKEKNISLSPLFLQLDEGEIHESVKHSEEPGFVVFEDGISKEELTTVEPPSNLAFPHAIDKPRAASSSDVFWRPMPKLAPLGLKSSNVLSDQRAMGNKSMPSLASAAVRLSPPKPID
ncbi:MAX gene-associated protein [Mantella aurantiaca]